MQIIFGGDERRERAHEILFLTFFVKQNMAKQKRETIGRVYMRERRMEQVWKLLRVRRNGTISMELEEIINKCKNAFR